MPINNVGKISRWGLNLIGIFFVMNGRRGRRFSGRRCVEGMRATDGRPYGGGVFRGERVESRTMLRATGGRPDKEGAGLCGGSCDKPLPVRQGTENLRQPTKISKKVLERGLGGVPFPQKGTPPQKKPASPRTPVSPRKKQFCFLRQQ